MSELSRRVVLCADDFGLTEGVSRAILDLFDRNLLSATSAMVNMPHWSALAPALGGRGGRIGVGLHLNLTTGSPLGAMPGLAPSGTFPALKRLMRGALAGQLSREEVRGEVERQFDRFEQAFGAPPAFVDGHQHVHVLPVVRGALVEVLGKRGYSELFWVRDPTDRISAILRRRVSAGKALTVLALAAGFGRAIRSVGLDSNDGFSGFSSLDSSIDAARVLRRALIDLGPRPVVMCHPGYVDYELKLLDPAVESREREMAYLTSEAFRDLLDERRIALVHRP